METVLHKANCRGNENHGWLNAWHSFSFANYYNPDRIHFGVLRVLNDDFVAPGNGFGKHPHKDMEIITIPLQGAIAHTDNLGNKSILKAGEVQVMSAGTGIIHSEFNASDSEMLNLLQIWIFPDKNGYKPSYNQNAYNLVPNQLVRIVSPFGNSGITIHQQAWFHLIKTDALVALKYDFLTPGNCLYIFVIDGILTFNNQDLNKRDAIGVKNTNTIETEIAADSFVLFMEIPDLQLQ